jgi:hypothetical protein
MLLRASNVALSDLTSSKLSSMAAKATKIIFPNYTSTLIQEIKIPRPLPQATAYNHPNILILTLPLSDGRAGEAWELSNKIMLFLPAVFPELVVAVVLDSLIFYTIGGFILFGKLPEVVYV